MPPSLLQSLLLLTLLLTSAHSLAEGGRHALIFGHNAYPAERRLENAISDAELVNAALTQCGFQTTVRLDGSIEAMHDALTQFRRKAQNAEAIVFYYAGHGLEYEGENYLLPVEADPQSPAQLRTQCLALKQVLEDLEAAKPGINLIVLDCCRNTLPLSTRSWLATRNGRTGLAPVSADSFAPGTAILFAAAPGRAAFDEDPQDARHGPFARALAHTLMIPGLNTRDLLDRVADQVFTATQQKQDPWVRYDGSARALRSFYFQDPTPEPIPVAKAIPSATPPVAPIALPDPTPITIPAPGPQPRLIELLDAQDREIGTPQLSPLGGPNLYARVIKNISNKSLSFQTQSETGWRTQILHPGTETFIHDLFGAPIRVMQQGRFQQVKASVYVQPYLNPAELNFQHIRNQASQRKVLIDQDPEGNAFLP
jgi:hypothetical protein